MILRNAVFGRGIARLAFLRTDCSLAGDAALQLIGDFRTAALLQRIGATACPERDNARA